MGVKRQVGGAAPDIEVEHIGMVLPGVGVRARAPGGQDALQVRPGGGHHKVSGKGRQGAEHFPRVFLPGGLPGDDDRAGADLALVKAGLPVLLFHNAPYPVGVDHGLRFQGRKVDVAAVEHLPLRDGYPRHGKGIGPVFQEQPRDDQLRGGGADINADR